MADAGRPSLALDDAPEVEPKDGSIEPIDDPPLPRKSWWPRMLLGAGVLILLAVVWLGFQVFQTYRILTSARDTVEVMQDEFAEHGISRPAELIALADQLREQIGDARSAVHDPVYRAATLLPWVGDNLEAASDLVTAVDGIAAQLPAAARLTPLLDGPHLLPHDGAVDLDIVRSGSEVMVAMDAAVRDAEQIVGSIDRSRLIGPLDDAVGQFHEQLPRVATMTAAGTKLAEIAGPMLGADGPRTYLVVFQNSAEPRATGGIFGSYAEVQLADGELSIVGQGAASRDIGRFDEPVGEIDDATEHLYTDLIGTYPMDVNFTPDFPAAAERFAQMFSQRTGRTVDGVVAIDPRTISRLLVARDPIVLADGTTLDSGNIVEFLLSDLYAKYPTGGDAPERDLYLAAATSAVFDRMISGGGDLRVTVSNLKDMVDERRVMVWSSHPGEQQTLLTTPVAGRLPDDPAARPSVGVFVNDGSGSKLGYYLDGATTLVPAECGDDGSRDLDLTVKLTDSSPDTGLSPYVQGGANGYNLQLNVLLVAPSGGSISEVLVDGESVPVLAGVDHGRAVSVATVVLGPGKTASITATATVPAGDAADVEPWLITTPGVRQWENHAPGFLRCP